MSKTITLRLEDDLYEKFKEHSKIENRSLSNFIETATKKYVDEIELVDKYEMNEILNNFELLESLKKGSNDVKQRRGRFV